MVENPDDKLHILTFDLIYCSIAYDFYDHQEYTRIKRKSKADLEQERIEGEIESMSLELEILETIDKIN